MHDDGVNRPFIRRDTSAALLVVGLTIGLVLGIGLGSRATIGGVTPTTSGPTGTSAIDVIPGAVSQRLRDAYYGSGGSTRVCIAGATVECLTAILVRSARTYSEITFSIDPTEFAALTPVHIASGHLIVVEDAGPIDGAAVVRIVGGVPINGRQLGVVNPGGRGIDYIDLGVMGAGLYVVAVPVPGNAPAGLPWDVPTALIAIAVGP